MHTVGMSWRRLLVGALVGGLTVTASFAAYYLWLAATADGADCTFDRFKCSANDALTTGIRWLMLWTLLLALLAVTEIARRRYRRGQTTVD